MKAGFQSTAALASGRENFASDSKTLRDGARALLAVCFATWLGLCPAARAAGEAAYPEAQIKVAYLVNFLKYIEWPAGTFAETNTPVCLAIVGRSEVGAFLERAVTGKLIAGRALHVKHLKPDDDPRGCQLLFVGADQHERARGWLEKTRGSPILTAGDGDRFLDYGGMIVIVMKDNKLRPRIHLPHVEQAGLRVSSKLLAVSDVVKTSVNQPRAP